jgi:hypothetical protein
MAARSKGSCFRDWCGEETNFPREIAEAPLAHVTGDKAERAYRRGDALEKRRALMIAGAVLLSTPAGSPRQDRPKRNAARMPAFGLTGTV